jgi:Protein of unknown function (DUF5818)
MMQKRARFLLWMVPALLVSLCPVFLYGAAQMGDEKAAKASATSVTGCLQKGDESGGFTITDKDGKVWELHSKAVKLSGHVGHTVTVSGTASSRSKAEEAKIEANEKKEAGGNEHADLQVSSLKMVSESCK